MENQKIKKPFYKKWWFWLIVGLFVLIVITPSNKPKDQSKNTNQPPQNVNVSGTNTNTNQQSQQAINQAINQPPQQVEQLTPEEELKNQLKSAIVKTGSTEVKYMDTEIDNADPDRPKGSKSITVKINVESFLTKKWFIGDTGKLSSNIFKIAYSSSLPISDVAVWYYGETKDKYGNTTQDVIQTYVMEKAVYSKINWNGLDQSKLCGLLNSEDPTGGNGCITLVNIQ